MPLVWLVSQVSPQHCFPNSETRHSVNSRITEWKLALNEVRPDSDLQSGENYCDTRVFPQSIYIEN